MKITADSAALTTIPRSSDDAYSNAITREREHWGKRLPAREANNVSIEDAAAAKELRINRGMPSFIRLAKDRGWHFAKVLSLGCGEGRAERELMKSGVCDAITGMDVSEDAVKVAQAKSDQAGYEIKYEVQDLNKATFALKTYDLIYSQNCLHHIVELEHVASAIAAALKHDGTLWVQDFIGESQFQWCDARLRIVNNLRESLPKELLMDSMRGKPLSPLKRKEPDTLSSPFEAIRSAEIVQVFERFFEITERWEGSTVVPFVCPRGTRASFLKHPAGPHLLDTLFAVDRSLLEAGTLSPTAGRYIMRAKLPA